MNRALCVTYNASSSRAKKVICNSWPVRCHDNAISTGIICVVNNRIASMTRNELGFRTIYEARHFRQRIGSFCMRSFKRVFGNFGERVVGYWFYHVYDRYLR